MSGALDGIRIIDFGQYLPGPLVAMLLADAGADVIRIDPPGGPRWQHQANAILQRGKRSLVLDLQQPADRATARRLINSADVVVENFRPGVMDRLGLGAREMTEANPELVYCSIPGFANDDPRADVAAFEGVVSAAAGVYLSGTWDASPDPAPVYNPVPLASSFGALRAAAAIVAALIVRQRGYGGQRIEAAMFDASFELKFTPQSPGNTRPRTRPRVEFDLILDAQFECADGRFVNLSWLEGRQLRAFAELVGFANELDRDGLLDETKLWTNGYETEELRRRLAAVFKTRTAEEWTRFANPAADLSNCQTTWEWLHQDPHARASGAVVSVVDPEYGPTVQAGGAFWMSKTPLRVTEPRHALDADRQTILTQLDRRPTPPAPVVNGRGLAGALEGVRVLDVTQVLAGPTCGRILAEFGAEVIKINNPSGRPPNRYASVNRGKRSMLLDLKTSDGLEVLWRLVERSDVFLMNFSPQAAERLGVAEADVRRHRPDIVYACVSAYGWEGPRGEYRGHEQMGQAVTGMQERWGRGSAQPIMQSMPVCDLSTGNLTALATMLGLFHRLRTGGGQFVGGSLAHSATFLQIPFMIDYNGRRWDDTAGQQARGSGPLNRLYRGSDRWFFMAARGPEALRHVEGLDDLNDAELESELTTRFAAAPAETWVARLRAAGVGAHINTTPFEVMEDSVSLARGRVELQSLPEEEPMLVATPSGKLSRTPLRCPPLPGQAGADNAALLAEVGLGERYGELLVRGVIADDVRPAASVTSPSRVAIVNTTI